MVFIVDELEMNSRLTDARVWSSSTKNWADQLAPNVEVLDWMWVVELQEEREQSGLVLVMTSGCFGRWTAMDGSGMAVAQGT